MKRIAYMLIFVLIAFMLFSCVRADNKDIIATTDGQSTDITDTERLPESETAKAETTEAETTVGDTESQTTVLDTTAAVPPETQPPVLKNEDIAVSYPVNPAVSTYTGAPALFCVQYTVFDRYNSRGISSVRHPFSYGAARDGSPHSITVNNQANFDRYGTNGLSWDNKSSEKVLYLTFDCGYKYGDLTARILNTLKEKEVKAAFFCTMDYIKADPAEVARMINEGHTVGNHSVTHPDCTTISREKLAWELLGVHNYMRVNFGYSPKYFRFPTGAYSENALELVNSVGYRSVFWSVAYADWDPENQQGAESAFSQVTGRLHPGAVILLHSTSPDNADILGRVIDHAHSQGYIFKTLDEYGYWN